MLDYPLVLLFCLVFVLFFCYNHLIGVSIWRSRSRSTTWERCWWNNL